MALKNSKKIEFMLIIVVFLVAGLGIANASDSKTEPVKKKLPKKELSTDNNLVQFEPPTKELESKHKSYPQSAPDDPYADIQVKKLGSISIPKVGMNQNLYEGVWLTVLDKGPGHWPGSSMPGEYGNMVVGGHRVTHSKPFIQLEVLVPGDEIIVTTDRGSFTYKHRETKIVSPEEVWIVEQTEGYQLTLFACHPKGSAEQRIVVFADLVR